MQVISAHWKARNVSYSWVDLRSFVLLWISGFNIYEIKYTAIYFILYFSLFLHPEIMVNASHTWGTFLLNYTPGPNSAPFRTPQWCPMVQIIRFLFYEFLFTFSFIMMSKQLHFEKNRVLNGTSPCGWGGSVKCAVFIPLPRKLHSERYDIYSKRSLSSNYIL